MSGRKDDEGKMRLDLIPPEAIRALGEVFTFGASKYEDRNWEKGIDSQRVYAAMERHKLAWLEGEKNDPESGLPHLYHLLTNAAMLVSFEARTIAKNNQEDSTGARYLNERVTIHEVGKDITYKETQKVIKDVLKEIEGSSGYAVLIVAHKSPDYPTALIRGGYLPTQPAIAAMLLGVAQLEKFICPHSNLLFMEIFSRKLVEMEKEAL